MNIRTDVFDLWTFRRDADEPRYLLLHTSQEKADKWFGGNRFWQIPGGYAIEGRGIVDLMREVLRTRGLDARSLWAVEHSYTIYNRRREGLEIIPVFAAEVTGEGPITLDWEHDEYRWATADECAGLIDFRGLIEGLEWTRRYVSEVDEPAGIFHLD